MNWEDIRYPWKSVKQKAIRDHSKNSAHCQGGGGELICDERVWKI